MGWEKNSSLGSTALNSLAALPRRRCLSLWERMFLRLWQGIIYLDDESVEYQVQKVDVYTATADIKAGRSTANFLQRCILQGTYVKKLRETKLRQKQVEQLVKKICSVVLDVPGSNINDILGPATRTPAICGNYELIEECIQRHPTILFWCDKDGSNFLSLAIKYRQEKVFNLIYQMSDSKRDLYFQADKTAIELLYLACELPPYHRLCTITGAALQMQRELQWFQEVEKLWEPVATELVNDEGKRPQEVFTEKHRQLLTDAQKWTTKTSTSSTVVAALIVTMTFAAMFTSPGGEFAIIKKLLVFIQSDAVGLFSSVTSVLMFLSTLTRSSQEDFLYALPQRLALGLISLLISLAATMFAFTAALVLVNPDQHWIYIPITSVAACVPAILFLSLHYPRLRELIGAAFGKSIFHRQSETLLH